VRYFKIAAKAGLNVSMFNLGWAFASGSGVPQSWEQAVKYWRRAARAGHSSAARNLGLLLSLGIAPGPDGEPRVDFTAAAQYYRLSADLGNHKACLALAQCYEQGQGVPQSTTDATYWRERGQQLQAKAQPNDTGYTTQ
jgi:TPR repeat protein